VATSRRRERELARRRFERRRAAELERRAKAKRRNTVIGAVVGTVVVLGAIPLILWAAGVFDSSGNKGIKAGSTPNPSLSPSASTSPTPAPPAPTKCAKITPNPPIKGAPTFPSVGKLSNKLVVKDLKVGHGRAAQKGDTVSVYYTGVSCDTGTMFDSSYKANPVQPFPVSPLGTAGVIPGWNQGLIGVKPGGVREMIIPASLAYGPTGQAPIQGNDTLDFIVQVKSVKKGS
jgi:peptidylprolyl isomerase